jgi:hypothetical protein
VAFLIVYVIGVVIGLAMMRDRWPARVATALVWPLGPIAFLVIVPSLLVVATILWPLVMLPLAAIVVAAITWLL